MNKKQICKPVMASENSGSSPGASQRIASQILEWINHSRLKPGDNLGTEKELAERFGSTGRSVREAILGLKSLGIVESRKRSGIRVGTPALSSSLSLGIELLGRSETGFQHLKELRFALEIGSVRLAANRMDEVIYQQFTEINERYGRVIQERISFPDLIKADRDFHQTLLRATGNPFLYEQHQVISEYFRRHVELNPGEEEEWEKRKVFHWEHTEIAAALRDGRVEYAQIILARHIGRVVFGTG